MTNQLNPESNKPASNNPEATSAEATAQLERDEWERQALYHHEEQQDAWGEGEYEQMMFEVEGY